MKNIVFYLYNLWFSRLKICDLEYLINFENLIFQEMEDTQIINTLTYCLVLWGFISHIYMTCYLGEEFEFQVRNKVFSKYAHLLSKILI